MAEPKPNDVATVDAVAEDASLLGLSQEEIAKLGTDKVDPADPIVTRSPDAPVDPQLDGDDAKMAAQRTGPKNDTFRAPSVTKASAINMLEVSWADFRNKLVDFDHHDDLPEGELKDVVDLLRDRA